AAKPVIPVTQRKGGVTVDWGGALRPRRLAEQPGGAEPEGGEEAGEDHDDLGPVLAVGAPTGEQGDGAGEDLGGDHGQQGPEQAGGAEIGHKGADYADEQHAEVHQVGRIVLGADDADGQIDPDKHEGPQHAQGDAGAEGDSGAGAHGGLEVGQRNAQHDPHGDEVEADP